MDRALVIKTGRNFTVLEGNRRLTAIRILLEPDLADGTELEAAVNSIVQRLADYRVDGGAL